MPGTKSETRPRPPGPSSSPMPTKPMIGLIRRAMHEGQHNTRRREKHDHFPEIERGVGHRQKPPATAILQGCELLKS